jgi:WD40 repeat protein
MNDSDKPIGDLTHEHTNKSSKSTGKRVKNSSCTTIAWNATGKKLFAGFKDGYVRVWHTSEGAK